MKTKYETVLEELEAAYQIILNCGGRLDGEEQDDLLEIISTAQELLEDK